MRSSVRAHLSGVDDGMTALAPVATCFPNFADFLARGEDEPMSERLRRAESIGRPVGDESFMAELEALTKRPLRPARRGPKPSRQAEARSEDPVYRLAAILPSGSHFDRTGRR